MSRWVSGLVAPRFVERARIVLACADGAPNARAAAEVGLTVATVRKWRGKFAAERMAGLEDAARIGRPKADLVLSTAERDQLTRWARRAKTAQYLALRARIVLRCAEGGTNRQAAIDLGVDESTPRVPADGRPADPYGPQDMLPRHTVPTAGVRPVRR